MRVKDIKINREYTYNNEVVTVVKRIKNNYTQKWFLGFGSKHQKINVNKETTFLLSNGKEVYAKELNILL